MTPVSLFPVIRFGLFQECHGQRRRLRLPHFAGTGRSENSEQGRAGREQRRLCPAERLALLRNRSLSPQDIR